MKAWMAVLIAASSSSAMAAFNAEFRLTGLSYELIDLRPEDGIAPAVDFAASEGRTSSFNELYSEFRDRPYFKNGFTEGIFTPFTIANRKPMASMRTEAVWNDGSLDITTRATAQATAPDRGGFETYLFKGAFFFLTPHTQMVWTGHYEMEASVEGGPDTSPSWNSWVYFRHPDEWREVTIEATAFGDPANGPAVARREGDISFTITNPYDYTYDRSVSLVVETRGGFISAVPEQSSYALMLLGAGVLGQVARKRRARGGDASR